ncbi:MAG TPA: dihydrofolate reductase family protein [Kofleriaceae bacterium]|nr:dihydrofolate reductase family protein [Kofleriaceae bacterium]
MQCSVYIATSLDGYIARPDGGLDWLAAAQSSGEDYGYAKFAATVDALVLGRATYDTVLGFGGWPYGGKRVVVLTHRPAQSRHGEEFHGGNVEDLARRLARDGVKRVYVDGGAVIQQFLAARLIDDLTISIIPVVLGAGIRLFSDHGAEEPLVLEGVDSYPTGLVQVRYRVKSRL